MITIQIIKEFVVIGSVAQVSAQSIRHLTCMAAEHAVGLYTAPPMTKLCIIISISSALRIFMVARFGKFIAILHYRTVTSERACVRAWAAWLNQPAWSLLALCIRKTSSVKRILHSVMWSQKMYLCTL